MHFVYSLICDMSLGFQLNMWKLEKTFTKILRALFAVGLLIAFLRFSAIPSIENFTSEKVVTEETENNNISLQSPAITICLMIVNIDLQLTNKR